MSNQPNNRGTARKANRKPNIIILVLFILWVIVTGIGTLLIGLGGGLPDSSGEIVSRFLSVAVFWVIMAVLFFLLDFVPDMELDVFKRGFGAVLSPQRDEEDVEEDNAPEKTPRRTEKKNTNNPTSRRRITLPPPSADDDGVDTDDDDGSTPPKFNF